MHAPMHSRCPGAGWDVVWRGVQEPHHGNEVGVIVVDALQVLCRPLYLPLGVCDQRVALELHRPIDIPVRNQVPHQPPHLHSTHSTLGTAMRHHAPQPTRPIDATRACACARRAWQRTGGEYQHRVVGTISRILIIRAGGDWPVQRNGLPLPVVCAKTGWKYRAERKGRLHGRLHGRAPQMPLLQSLSTPGRGEGQETISSGRPLQGEGGARKHRRGRRP